MSEEERYHVTVISPMSYKPQGKLASFRLLHTCLDFCLKWETQSNRTNETNKHCRTVQVPLAHSANSVKRLYWKSKVTCQERATEFVHIIGVSSSSRSKSCRLHYIILSCRPLVFRLGKQLPRARLTTDYGFDVKVICNKYVGGTASTGTESMRQLLPVQIVKLSSCKTISARFSPSPDRLHSFTNLYRTSILYHLHYPTCRSCCTVVFRCGCIASTVATLACRSTDRTYECTFTTPETDTQV